MLWDVNRCSMWRDKFIVRKSNKRTRNDGLEVEMRKRSCDLSYVRSREDQHVTKCSFQKTFKH